ncbi:SDR family NAD(P)-dependent oxidoreductase [Dictyobacter arantiisoli]|uniref:SDR family NAD(P)-dependent oxidoreductase n=1 Tax=Dictyobacter arantiisoli TaxID=2014874 RepID=UPI00155A638E|nr:SDR family NAD(P)-dependent oxidoreductase [Dictyobacter arantiisoli]
MRTTFEAAPRVLNVETLALLAQEIHTRLLEALPGSYGVARSSLTHTASTTSLPIDIVLYDKLHSEDNRLTANQYALKSVLAVIQLCPTMEEAGLREAVEAIASVKALRPYRPIPLATQAVSDLSTRVEKIPKQALPIGIILSRRGATDKAHRQEDTESLSLRLYTLITEQPLALRPDYLFALDDALYYRNPAFDGRVLTGHETGLYREPDHPNFPDCYVCKERFFRQHFFYRHLCARCGDLNYARRSQQADLRGFVAVVTGARVRIGYAAALKLLRAGASVIVTTRFPHDAAGRYVREPDYAQWCERLDIYGLDLRYLPGIERFTQYVATHYGHLDILINNAAQTVRRPPAYYAHLLPFEMQPYAALPALLQVVLRNEQLLLAPANDSSNHALQVPETMPFTLSTSSPSHSSAAFSQLSIMASDERIDPQHFPPDRYDESGQQLDLRPDNSWTKRLEQLAMPEILETQLINSIAPTMLIQQFQPLLARHQHAGASIINVSSIEGQFASMKTGVHPHSNMAKAALNMLTLTIATDLARQGIYINSVDPGWISQQVPYAHRIPDEKIPLDEIDAAARICDLIFQTAQCGQSEYGKFWKDYLIASW